MAKRFLLVGANDEGICHVQDFFADSIKEYVREQVKKAMVGDGEMLTLDWYVDDLGMGAVEERTAAYLQIVRNSYVGVSNDYHYAFYCITDVSVEKVVV